MGYQPTKAGANPTPPKVAAPRGLTNCPNCNAVLSYVGGLHCDYCGTRFEKPDEVIIRSWYGEPVRSYRMSDWSSPPNLTTR